MGIFRPIIKRLPPKAQTGMALVIVAALLVAFAALSIYQRFTPASSSKIVLMESPTTHQIQSDELIILKRTNPAFYRDAEAGDWVLRYPDRVVLYRVSTEQIVVSLPVTR